MYRPILNVVKIRLKQPSNIHFLQDSFEKSAFMFKNKDIKFPVILIRYINKMYDPQRQEIE